MISLMQSPLRALFIHNNILFSIWDSREILVVVFEWGKIIFKEKL